MRVRLEFKNKSLSACLNMSQSKNHNSILSDKNRKDIPAPNAKLEDEDVVCDPSNSVSYSVTVSKKTSELDTENATGQKSFISIHSTDLPCLLRPDGPTKLAECSVEVISITEGFPSTSEESLADGDDDTAAKVAGKGPPRKAAEPPQKAYAPSNSRSTTDERARGAREGQAGYSDCDIPKGTLYVIGSNPGEPKKCYNDPPKKISKTMRKFLRSIDKQAIERGRSSERDKARVQLTRGILKERHFPECTGDVLHDEPNASEQSIGFMEWAAPSYTKQGHPSTDKNVTFNTQVIIIHFTGDLCVGQSVETLSKERDQQARNSELRRTFLTKYNEFWPQKL